MYPIKSDDIIKTKQNKKRMLIVWVILQKVLEVSILPENYMTKTLFCDFYLEPYTEYNTRICLIASGFTYSPVASLM